MRAWAYTSKGDMNLAIESLDELVKINPDYSNAYILKGNIYKSLKKYKNAISEFQLAIQILSKTSVRDDKIRKLQEEINELQQIIKNNQWWNKKIF
jgi:tetratricopeptide (TPR) repeat protein